MVVVDVFDVVAAGAVELLDEVVFAAGPAAAVSVGGVGITLLVAVRLMPLNPFCAA